MTHLPLVDPERDRLDMGEVKQRFTDRQNVCTLFSNLLEATPPNVLMLYGLGGIGKSFLLRYLLYARL